MVAIYNAKWRKAQEIDIQILIPKVEYVIHLSNGTVVHVVMQMCITPALTNSNKKQICVNIH